MALSREDAARGLLQNAVYSVVVQTGDYDTFEDAFRRILGQENGGVAENHLRHKGTRITGTMVLWTDISGMPYLEDVLRKTISAYRERGGKPFVAERSLKSRMEIPEVAS